MAVLGTRALNRALLARQLLLAPADVMPVQLVEHLVGLQAQHPTAPYLGIWSRIPGVTTGAISALIADRSLVRIAAMRSTVHLFSTADARWIRPVVQAAVAKGLTPGSGYGRMLTGLDREEVAAVAASYLQEPRSTAALGEHLCAVFPERDRDALMILARCLLPLVQVPPKGLWGMSGGTVLTTLQAFVGPDPADDRGPGDLVRRYLAAFGPATVRDVQHWSGLTRLGPVVAGIRDELVAFTGEDGRELFDLPDAPRPDPAVPPPVRLLAEWDNILLGHADRSRILPPEYKDRVFSQNGIVRGAVLVDGMVAGAWKLRTGGPRATVELQPFTRFRKADLRAAEQLAADALRFGAPEAAHEISVLEP
ncbi:winged helix DNA-binding domain-containing protein [Nakamurella sp. YIM 132087]|uniref:Winged helix DNA-binding domain-containing protein n=1 Tax=Nakamurella alba TaxID=2665158 RepID=A0A7K1FK15_9ACTN|nr:winged helix DNA-binding domain-containing protein [Nakamurella alba]MTD14481.1 winged helix DNA-binding domain-containing protein [Nakamurella alba]